MTGLFSRDVQVKTMEQTVVQAEKHLGQLCSLMASYTRKTAKVRDKSDLLVGQLLEFSRTEEPELQLGLKNLAEDLAMVQDYRQAQCLIKASKHLRPEGEDYVYLETFPAEYPAQPHEARAVERLESRVVAPLKAYGDVVRTKRADLKKFSADRNREMKEIQKLEKIRLKNPADRQSIAEVSAQKASNNAQRSTRQLEEAIVDFQRNKLEDIQRIFTDFVTVEMLFHAKALEVYTHTFHNLEAMDLQKDLELFSGRVHMPDFLSTRVDSPVSGLSGPLMTMYHSPLLSPSHRGTLREPAGPDTQPIPRPRSTLRRQRHTEEEPERAEEEEEEEEEEMSESDTEAPVSRQSYAAQYATQYAQVRRWHQ